MFQVAVDVLSQIINTTDKEYFTVHAAKYIFQDDELDRLCLGVWLWFLFKIFFTQKSTSIIFFYFLKIIFEINTSK
jgi:hypothetical protein